MNRYKCLICGGSQYTSADTAEWCIYCGHNELKKMERSKSKESEGFKVLTKKQLKDAARCYGWLCEICSCNKTRGAYQDCIREAAKTALVYREMLERARKMMQYAWDDDGSAIIGNQILKTINAIDALLEGEKDA